MPPEGGAPPCAVAYLDHAATTPVLPQAAAAFAAALHHANPSSLHRPGRAARAALEEAREQIADALGAEPAEVVLTSGGCEADTLAVLGGALAAHDADPDRAAVAVSDVEHVAVLASADAFARHHGGEVRRLAVDATGTLDLDRLETVLEQQAARLAVVSVMWANNETGTIQPVEEVAERVRRHAGMRTIVHTDAVQALGHIPLDLGALDVDALTVSGHKIGAPAGIGALVVRRTVPLAPVIQGAGQERGVRSGTVPVALAAALAAAVSHAVRTRVENEARIRSLRERLERGVLARVPRARIDGGERRLPGITHLTLPGADVDALLFALDAGGVAASAGSACHAGLTQASHVMLASGASPDDARSVLRLSLGTSSTRAEVDRVLEVLPEAVERARAAGEVARAFRRRTAEQR